MAGEADVLAVMVAGRAASARTERRVAEVVESADADVVAIEVVVATGVVEEVAEEIADVVAVRATTVPVAAP